MAFQDHFSSRAAQYAQSRPHYPPELFAALAQLSPARALAWDCGTGNGQAAIGLADHFDRVLATDPSPEQLAHASNHPRITYKQSPESESGLLPGTADLVTAAQAAHWFDLPAFYAEARRVLKPNGLIAIWCYELCHITPQLDALLKEFHDHTIAPCWPPQRRHVNAGYRTLPFPFDELPLPPFAMELDWTLHALAAYLRTWSAVTRFTNENATDPVTLLLEQISPHWGNPNHPRRIIWPLMVRVGR